MTKTYYLFRIWLVFGSWFLLFMFHSSLYAQEVSITGVITDGQGPIVGASIIIKHTAKGTISDFDGHYELYAKPTDSLEVQYMGYKPIVLPVGHLRVINVSLQEDATTLGEVTINAGYYRVKDKERTGSIAKVNAETIAQQPVNTAIDALQGRVAGLDIIPTTGLAGGGYTVRIRGQSSIAAGNDPLYVIDGVPFDTSSMGSSTLNGMVLPRGQISPLNTLDPASIASIEVLKDADATSIYGSRGANGVILITTKRGKAGETVVTVEASSALITATTMLDLLNTEAYLAMRREAFEQDGITAYPATAYDVNGTWDETRTTDWQEVFLGNPAYNETVKASVTGGDTRTQFSFWGSYMKETTVFPKDYSYKKGAFYGTLSHGATTDRFRFQLSANYGTDSNVLPTADLSAKAKLLAPNAPELYDETGQLNWADNTWQNPYAELESSYENQSKTLLANTVLSYRITPGLDFKMNMGYTLSDLLELQLNPHTRFNPSYGLTSAASDAIKNTGNRQSWLIEPQLNADYKLGSGELQVTVGATFQNREDAALTVYGFGYANNSLLSHFSAAQQLRFLNETNSQYRYLALYARLNYTWKSRYILNFTGRRDGSSRFGSGNQFANFGAVGAAWIFSRASFIKDWSGLSFGKLRGSFGITGNDQIGDYQYLDTYTISNGTYNGNIGLKPSRLYNPYYAWEKNRKLEFALEVGFLKNRFRFEAAYYNNLSSNQLLGIPLPGTTGFSTINANLNATVENKGMEFSLSTINFQHTDFDWKTDIQFSLPKNALTAFEGLEQSTYANQLVIGAPLSITKQYHLLGVNSETGVFEFEDYNNDGAITTEDKQYVSNLTPTFYGNIANSLRYKHWYLDMNFQFVKKAGYNELAGTDYPGGLRNQPSSVLHHWQALGDEAAMQVYTSGGQSDAVAAYSRFKQSSGVVSDASFIRLKSLSLSYKLPLKQLPSMDCTLFMQGQNLLTFTKLKSGDPEQLSGFMPPLRRLLFGVRLQL